MTRKLLRPAVLVVRAAWAGCTKLIQLAQILNARKGGRLRGRPWLSSLREIAAIGGHPSPPPNLSSVWPHRCANKQPSSDFSTSLLLRTAPKPQSSHLANPRRHAAF